MGGGNGRGRGLCAWQNVVAAIRHRPTLRRQPPGRCSVYTVQETIPLSPTSWTANRLDLFARGSDQSLVHKSWNGSAWSTLEPLGGVIRGKPASVAWGPNRSISSLAVRTVPCSIAGGTAIPGAAGNRSAERSPAIPRSCHGPATVSIFFAAGTDGELWHKAWTGSAWGGWETLGGVIVGPPAAISWGANRLDIFARGLDGANVASLVGWACLARLGVARRNHHQQARCRCRGDPIDSISSARGLDGGVYHRWWDGHDWGGWEALGGTIIGPPSAVTWGPNRIDLFVHNSDHNMGHKWFDGHTWSVWESLGGTNVGTPVPLSRSANRLDVFSRGADNALWQQAFDGRSWSARVSLGGVMG